MLALHNDYLLLTIIALWDCNIWLLNFCLILWLLSWVERLCVCVLGSILSENFRCLLGRWRFLLKKIRAVNWLLTPINKEGIQAFKKGRGCTPPWAQDIAVLVVPSGHIRSLEKYIWDDFCYISACHCPVSLLIRFS